MRSLLRRRRISFVSVCINLERYRKRCNLRETKGIKLLGYVFFASLNPKTPQDEKVGSDVEVT